MQGQLDQKDPLVGQDREACQSVGQHIEQIEFRSKEEGAGESLTARTCLTNVNNNNISYYS